MDAHPARPLTWWTGLAALAALWLAQVSIPLLHRGSRAIPTSLVVLFLGVATASFTVLAAGWRRGVAVMSVVTALGLAAEVAGTRTGFPFGYYEYTGALRPTLAGVPIVVVLAWAGMGLPAWAVACRLVRHLWARVAVGALALSGWDLFLDPQMVREGYWVWPGGGPYRGIPLSNYAGWLLASAIVMLAVYLVAGGVPSLPLALTYLLMSVMEALGFAVFFGDPFVALVGGVVCLPLALAAARGPAVAWMEDRFGRAPPRREMDDDTRSCP